MACNKKIRSTRKMNVGGLVGSTLSGVAGGTTLGPAGMLIGGGIGLAQGISNYLEDKQQETYQQDLLKQQQLRIRQNAFNNSLVPQYQNIPLMPYGGSVQTGMVELERGEVYRTPDGIMSTIPMSYPSHAQGGVPMELPVGTDVLGKKKIMGKEFKEIGRKLEKAQSKYLKALESNLTNITANTAERSLSNISKQFNGLFELQGEDTGYYKMPDGGVVPASYKADSTIITNYRPTLIKTQDYRDYQKADIGDILSSRPLYNPTNPKQIIATENYYKGVPGAIYLRPGDTTGDYIERYTTPEGNIRFAGSELPNTEYAKGGTIHIKPENRGKFNATKAKTGKSTEELTHSKNPLTRKRAIFAQNAAKWRKGEYGLKVFADGGLSGSEDMYPSGKGKTKKYPMVSKSDFARPGSRSYPIPTKADAIDALRLASLHGASDVKAKVYTKYPSLRKGEDGLTIDYNDNPILQGVNAGYTWVNPMSQYTAPQVPTYTMNQNTNPTNLIPYANEMINPLSTTKNYNFDLGNIMSTTGQLAPVAYNISRGLQEPEQLTPSDYYNPYNNQIRNAMINRRYNISPELESNKLAEATYYRNLMESAPSTSQYLGGLQAGQIATQRANAAAIARKQNIDNQYLAEQAQMDYSLGRDIANIDYQISDINARAGATQRNLIGTGLGQLSQFAQNKELMNNQVIRDAQRLNLLPDLIANYTFENGKWKFKATGREVPVEEVMNYVKGKMK